MLLCLKFGQKAERAVSLTGKDESIYCTYAPPDMWSRTQESGKEKVYLFRSAGLNGIVKASNDREAGWLCIKELLRLRENGEPRLHIFSSCRELIKNLPLLCWRTREVFFMFHVEHYRFSARLVS